MLKDHHHFRKQPSVDARNTPENHDNISESQTQLTELLAHPRTQNWRSNSTLQELEPKRLGRTF